MIALLKTSEKVNLISDIRGYESAPPLCERKGIVIGKAPTGASGMLILRDSYMSVLTSC